MSSASCVDLWCADAVLRIDASLCHMATARVHWRAFRVPHDIAASAVPRFTVRRLQSVDGQKIEGPLGDCIARIGEDSLEVSVSDGPFLGELVLRLAWYLATARLGGVLLHAAAIAHQQRAIVACGKSGAGKSTLSRLCGAAGLTLLTDEIVQVFPDGRVGGTPFRSDFDNVGSPGLVRATHFLSLRHAPLEALEFLGPTAAAQLALSQCFEMAEVEQPRSKTRRRLLGFLGATSQKVLAFRKHPEAADFIRRILGDSQG